MKTICYFGHNWAGNIGNAFIDYAINYCLKKVTIEEETKIINISNHPASLKYNFGDRNPFSILAGKGKTSPFDLRLLSKPDVVILGGSLFDIFWSKVHKPLIDWLAEHQTPVIVLGGGGGNSYSQTEIDYVKQVWSKVNVHTYISRDDNAYNNFNEIATKSYSGIDNAFFLADLFTPFEQTGNPFGVKAFDLTHNRKVDFGKGLNEITLGHRLVDVDSIKYFLKNGLRTFKIVKQYDMISDYPDDYLHIYGNAAITHSDRVHACVATLSFGGKAQYYDKSDRSFLFERVKLGAIRNELVSLDQDFIAEEKIKQLGVLKSSLHEIFQ
jgi:hypothetical protein